MNRSASVPGPETDRAAAGVGFVVVRSEADGNIVLGKEGAYYLDKGEIQGDNPLANFSPNAPELIKRQSHYQNAPDILVSGKCGR